MSSTLINLTRRVVSTHSRTIASSSRTISTTQTETETAPQDLLQSSPVLPFNLPKTPPPTPYHPYVHVPLTPFTKLDSPLLSGMTEPLLVPLPSPLFNTASRPTLLHKLVIAHLASLRMGTASTKNRSEVNFSGKKIRPQKGTGKARLGSRGSPMLTGGGRAFGPRPKGEDGWNRKVNRKEERLGLRVGLSEKWRSGQLTVVDSLEVEDISTRVLRTELLKRNWLDALFIVGKGGEADVGRMRFELSSGNLSDVAVVSEMDALGVYDIIKRQKVIIELEALEDLITRLDPEGEWGQTDEELAGETEEGELMGEEEMARELEEALQVNRVEAKASCSQ